MCTRIDTQVPLLETAPELATLAILDSALEVAQDALFAADRDVVPTGYTDYVDLQRIEPPELHIARAILEQAATLRSSLYAYGKAVTTQANHGGEIRF